MGSNPVFPNIFYNYNISYLLNLININKNHKNLIFTIILTKNNLLLLNILKSFNVIYKFMIIKNNNSFFIKIYLYYYKKKPMCSFFKVISKPSKSFLVSHKALSLINKRTGSSIFIISNNKGLISHKIAIKQKLGGLFIGFFSI